MIRTNTELLEKKILESGKKKNYLARKINLSHTGFWNCIHNKAEFKATHIDILCSELGIIDLEEKESIFFAKSG
jgi:hypothetical protein